MKIEKAIKLQTRLLVGMDADELRATAETSRIASQIPGGLPTLSFTQAEMHQSLCKDSKTQAALDLFLTHWIELEERDLRESCVTITRQELWSKYLSHGVCPGLLLTHEGEGDTAVAIYRLQKCYSIAKASHPDLASKILAKKEALSSFEDIMPHSSAV